MDSGDCCWVNLPWFSAVVVSMAVEIIIVRSLSGKNIIVEGTTSY